MIQMNLEEPDGLQFVGLQRVTQDLGTNTFTLLFHYYIKVGKQ